MISDARFLMYIMSASVVTLILTTLLFKAFLIG